MVYLRYFQTHLGRTFWSTELFQREAGNFLMWSKSATVYILISFLTRITVSFLTLPKLFWWIKQKHRRALRQLGTSNLNSIYTSTLNSQLTKNKFLLLLNTDFWGCYAASCLHLDMRTLVNNQKVPLKAEFHPDPVIGGSPNLKVHLECAEFYCWPQMSSPLLIMTFSSLLLRLLMSIVSFFPLIWAGLFSWGQSGCQ